MHMRLPDADPRSTRPRCGGRKSKFLAAIFFALLPLHFSMGAPNAVYKNVVKLLVGEEAVRSFANGSEAATIFKQKLNVVSDIERRGLSATDGAVFQIYFQVDPNASDRWFFHPNVYARVQLEGQGDFVPASISKSYSGQKLSLTVYGRQVRPGGRILVEILDDKEFWNSTWNSLLKTEIGFHVAGLAVTPMAAVKIDSGGKIRLLNKDITLVAPGYMATADITVPQTPDGTWLANGKLFDRKQLEVGFLQFGQIWRADPRVVADVPKLAWKTTYWIGLGVVLSVIFVSQFFRKKNKTASKES